MKKVLLLILILLFGMQICSADEENIDDINSYFIEDSPQTQELHGYLEYNQQPEAEQAHEIIQLNQSEVVGIKISKPKSFNSKSLVSNIKKPTFYPIQDNLDQASKFSSQEYDINSISGSLTKQFGKFTFGTTYDSSVSSAQVNYSTGLFSRYDNKHFAFSAGFLKNTNSNYDSYNDKFFMAPELKLTKRLSLLDVMQTDVDQINKKNELVLRYTPHFKKYADDVQFELGAGQSFYEDSYVKSSLRFSTRFKL